MVLAKAVLAYRIIQAPPSSRREIRARFWRGQLLEGAAGVFGLEGHSEPVAPAIEVKTLPRQNRRVVAGERLFCPGARQNGTVIGGAQLIAFQTIDEAASDRETHKTVSRQPPAATSFLEWPCRARPWASMLVHRSQVRG